MKEGWFFSFHPSYCVACPGYCCIGESGYVWVEPKAIDPIAQHLGLAREVFMERYLMRVGNRYSAREVILSRHNYVCVFFDTGKKRCSIYEVRPLQCRTFPFWEHFKTYPEEAARECPGVKVF